MLDGCMVMKLMDMEIGPDKHSLESDWPYLVSEWRALALQEEGRTSADTEGSASPCPISHD